MFIQWQLSFQPQGIARAQSTGDHSEFPSSLQQLVPYHGARWLVGRNIDLKTVLCRIARSRNQRVRQSANGASRHPVKLHRAEVGIGQLLQQLHSSRTLYGNLREVIAQIFDSAVETAGV